jgi:CspA family cold shock protein
MQDKKQQGTCRWFSKEKGYGFIVAADGKDIFVHYSCIKTEVLGRKTLKENDKVEFNLKEDDEGTKAVDVVVVNE